MIKKIISAWLPVILIALLIILSYNNIVFLRRSLNPVLLIPPAEIRLSTGYADISGTETVKNGWQVDLANPAYLEWPVNVFIGKSLRAGHIPLVLPYQDLGVPLIGQYCHRVLSPYQMIENLFFPHGYDFFILLRLILAGIFTYLFIRPLCRRPEAALLAALGYGLGSIMVIYSNHEEVSNVALMLPLLIWSVRAFFDRPGIGRAAWLALALALVHTAGQPEIQLYVLLLAFIYGITRILSLPARDRKAAISFALLAIILSAVIAAPQIYPFLKFHREAWTYHPPGGNLGLQAPMRITRFLFAFFPKLSQGPRPWAYRTINLIWDWVGGYFSLGLLFLAAAAARSPRRNRREIFLFGGYFFFILAKNLGWSPAQLIGLIPFFDQTWSPRWAAATWSFSLAVLAGFGLDNILNSSSEPAALSPREPEQFQSRLRAYPGFRFLHILLLALVVSLAIFFRYQGKISWEAGLLRQYVLASGILFILVAALAFLLYRLLRRTGQEIIRSIGRYLANRQIILILLFSGGVVVGLRWLPLRYYSFTQPEPASAYLFAAPLLLLSLFGLFYIATSSSNPRTVGISAVAIPLLLLSGWFNPLTGAESLPTIYLLHAAFAMVLIAVFSGLRLWADRGGTGCGWFFLILVWTELTIYLQKNHSDRFLLIDVIPFLIAGLVVLAFAIWFRRSPVTPKRRNIYLLTGVILCGGAILIIDVFSSVQLPRQCVPEEPLPFIKYLQDKKPAAVVGIGRVLSPNFASAHGLTDLRGCVSMNTGAYQFFLSNILRVVLPDSSFSLWYTGDNNILKGRGTAYNSSLTDHILALKMALPFFSLASARYVLCPRTILDSFRSLKRRGMRKVYSGEVDIWEIPALPAAFIAHQAEVISMLSDTRRWGIAVVNDEDILRGDRVILEEDPPAFLPESRPDPADRAELITGANPNLLRVRFHTEKPGYLVINRAYTNLLRAYLDGEELPVLKANGPFMAVPVPGSPEERVLELTYLSPPVKFCFLLSILGLLIVGGGLILGAARRNSIMTKPR